MLVEYDCIQCGVHVKKIRSPSNLLNTPQFCSQRCHGNYKRGSGKGIQLNVEYICETCGKRVKTYRSPSAREAIPPKYCSLKCIGVAQRGENNPSYSGGRHKLNTGYMVALAPEHPFADIRGYVLEHRLVMEQILGRYLTEEEVVHHINGFKDDNRPENLQLFPSHSEHMRHHSQMRKEIVNAQ